MEECKYRLCGIIVAPTIPNAIYKIPLFVMISVWGTKPFNKFNTFGEEI